MHNWYSIYNSTLTAVPVKSPFELPYTLKSNGTIEQITEEKPFRMRLMAEGYMARGYYMNTYARIAEAPLLRPVYKNQDTEDDLINADILIGKFSGLPSKKLTNVTFTHGNNLLDFELKGIPNSATLTVNIKTSVNEFRPLKINELKYRAVIMGDWLIKTDLFILLNIGDKPYKLKLLDAANLKRDRHYQFTLQYNTGNDGFDIQKDSETKWSDEKWPK